MTIMLPQMLTRFNGTQSLICINGSRMSCGGSNDRVMRWIMLFLVLVVAFTILFIINTEHDNFKKTLLIQAKYSEHGNQNFKEPTDLTDESLGYGIVLDCGSSGTRVYIYYWPPHNGDRHQLLDIHQLIGNDGKPMSKKITPGLSTYDSNATFSAEYLRPVLDYAKNIVPKTKHRETPLYILATAGMRLIDQQSVKAILDDITIDIPSWYDFHFEKTHVEVISGESEGMYAWISLNYMLGRFSTRHTNAEMLSGSVDGSTSSSSQESHSDTVGVIDMGGGSMQIAFEVEDPSSLKSRDHVKSFNINSDDKSSFHSYTLYVTTFLGFGANSALGRHKEELMKAEHPDDSPILSDNCLPYKAIAKSSHNNKEYQLKGTGNMAACVNDIKPLLNQSVACHTQPCSLNGVYQPPIPLDSTFYGISEYWYSVYDVLNLKGYYDHEKVFKAAKDYCETAWSSTMKKYDDKLYPNADMHRMVNECFKVSWIMTVLHDGLHFPTNYNRLLPVEQINGQEVQWSLGALVYKTRYLPAKHISHVADKYKWTRHVHTILPYALLLCFVIVIGAIVLYCRHLQRMKVVPSLKSVPSMSYFMTTPGEMEQGLLTEKFYVK